MQVTDASERLPLRHKRRARLLLSVRPRNGRCAAAFIVRNRLLKKYALFDQPVERNLPLIFFCFLGLVEDVLPSLIDRAARGESMDCVRRSGRGATGMDFALVFVLARVLASLSGSEPKKFLALEKADPI